jgi:hypothetical protein
MWAQFVADVKETLDFLNKPVVKPTEPETKPTAIPEWEYNGVKYLHDNGLLDDIDGWSKKITEEIPVWAATTLMANTYSKITKVPVTKATEWKLNGIETLHTEGIISDALLWTSKKDENIPVWAAAVMLMNLCKKVKPEWASPKANDWKTEGIVYLNQVKVLDDLTGWSAKKDEAMPVWAFTILLSNTYKALIK